MSLLEVHSLSLPPTSLASVKTPRPEYKALDNSQSEQEKPREASSLRHGRFARVTRVMAPKRKAGMGSLWRIARSMATRIVDETKRMGGAPTESCQERKEQPKARPPCQTLAYGVYDREGNSAIELRNDGLSPVRLPIRHITRPLCAFLTPALLATAYSAILSNIASLLLALVQSTSTCRPWSSPSASASS